ncbi:MAG: SusC/RagA family TonB-linked outer membrane protein [Ferruginibacter sp.]|nr:SusC/RagA family TonB-linked outer membrane protein [Cytophagales bacterium]
MRLLISNSYRTGSGSGTIAACCLLLTVFSREAVQAKTPLPKEYRPSPVIKTTAIPRSAAGNLTKTRVAVTISGKVTSQEGEALAGVSVVIKGTSTGTATDANGAYTVNADAGATLVFSFIGYTTQEVPVGNRTVINVTLVPDIETLSEVVVTALGIKREAKTLGYATATVAPEQITTNRTANFMNALQGKIAGVNITSLGTGPAGTSKVRIRGQSSFGGQNNPLIVLNGVPIDNTNFGINPGNLGSDGATANRGTFNNSDGGDGLSSINPDDIESMTVLKGATAAALYGSRAKDGVIMINTKSRGSGQGIGVEWNSNFVVDTPLDFTDFQYEYGQGENGIRPTAANPTSGVWSFGERFQPGMTQVLFGGVTVPYEPVRNRIRNFYRDGSTWTNTVTLSAGGERGGFNLSLASMDNRSIVPNSQFNRKTINLGFTQNIVPKLTVSGNVNYSNEYNQNAPQIAQQDLSTPTVLYTLANSMPLDVLEQNRYDASGNEFIWSRFRNRTNPYISIYDRFENIRRDRVFGNITARYNFTDWLYAQGRIGQDYYSRDQDYNFPTGAAPLAAAPSGFVNGQFIQESRRFRETNVDLLVGGNRKFGDFGLDVNLGGNQRYVRSDLNSVSVQDFVVRGLYTVMNGRIKDPFYGLTEKQINSLYGTVGLSYKEFLYLNATARNDWFSTLSPVNRSILYPSVTGSFVFSQAFAALPGWLSFGKLRAAYAEVGSDLDVAPYANSLYYAVNNNFFPNQDGQPQPVGIINASTIPNADLRPMRVSEVEFGLELKLFDNRVGLDLTYYDKTTSDQILSAQVSDGSGYTNRLINVGKSKNRGVEMLLNVTPVKTARFQWDATLNASYNTSEVLALVADTAGASITVGTGIFAGELRQVVGQPLGQLYAFGYRRDAQGRPVFDANNGQPLRTPAQLAFGSAIPKWVGGITNTFVYQGINLSFLIDFKLGHQMISGTNFNAWRHGLHKGTLPGREENFVVGNGVNPNGEVNTRQTNLQTFYETVRSSNIAEEFVYDAGFWKLRQITLGYDFTRFLPKTFLVKGLRLSAVANNVAVLKKWVPNIDPEQFGFSSDNLIGLESTGLPITRSIGFNLNAKF